MIQHMGDMYTLNTESQTPLSQEALPAARALVPEQSHAEHPRQDFPRP